MKTNYNIWAIQQIKNEFFDFEFNEDIGILKFIWSDLLINNITKKEDFVIHVALKMGDEVVGNIKSIAKSIYNFKNIKTNDVILGVIGSTSINKIGIVTEITESFNTGEFNIYIKWDKDFESINIDNSIFIEEIFVNKLNSKLKEKLNLNNLNYLNLNYDNYQLKYYSNKIYSENFDSAEVSQEYRVHSKIINSKVEKINGGLIKLFYGTNRKIKTRDNDKVYFEDEIGELSYGTCEVSIPRGHKQGNVERPFNLFWTIELPEKANDHIILRKVDELSLASFIDEIKLSFVDSIQRSALIFIHGYNNSFEDAAYRTAQIAWDIPFEGISGFFSWPSGNSKIKYLKDVEAVDSSIIDFEKFLEEIILKTGVEKIHLIAHSMGNRLLTSTFNHLRKNERLNNKLNIFNQIILAAPDIDQIVFEKNILPYFKNIGERRTLYTYNRDIALQISKFIRSGNPRLGDSGENIFVSKEIDTIDASNVLSSYSHSYIFETNELLTDLYFLINKGLKPLDRRLFTKSKNSISYYLFPR